MKPTTDADNYESFYREFDSPRMRQFRRAAYGEDIGQHSWASAEELRGDIPCLGLSRSSRILDLGCGPCGPLTFILAAVGCQGVGVEQSEAALQIGRERALALGIADLLSVQAANLDEPLPFESGSFDAAISIDVVLHLRDRRGMYREVARLLRPGGRFLVSDAGVLTGTVSNEETRKRSLYGFTQFVAPGVNEGLLEAAGFRLLETEDRTASALRNAGGRLAAIQAHPAELAKQRDYLETVIALAERGALSRFMYLAEVRGP
ncbi:MAG: class I SAM-dependent methyltransferase [Steroidobacteraceae bacterium]